MYNVDNREERYLVRELKLIKGEDCKVFPLHYVNIAKDMVEIKPFDQERAGYIYVDRMTLYDNGQRKLYFESEDKR